jgi:electron transfer flavoprotein alpha subunit
VSLLGVAFRPEEVAQISGLAAVLGMPFQVLLVQGEPGDGHGATAVKPLRASPTAEELAPAIRAAAEGHTHVAAVSSMAAKDALARAAGLLQCPMVTDVVRVESPTVFVRPVVAGSVLATVEALASPVVLTFRPAGFPAAAAAGPAPTGDVPALGPTVAQRLSATVRKGSRPDLGSAKLVVTGGRPLKDSETFERVIGGLADKLGGAVGATRAAVDSGIAPNELQVGQTGKTVAPDLYIAAGVSGSTQHMAGIKDSKTIVAVNKDPDAPIFEVADLGLVADLFDALPELQSKLA